MVLTTSIHRVLIVAMITKCHTIETENMAAQEAPDMNITDCILSDILLYNPTNITALSADKMEGDQNLRLQ